MKKLALTAFAALLAGASLAEVKPFGKIKSNEKMITSVEVGEGLGLTDKTVIHHLMAGFVNVPVIVNSWTFTNEYAWMEKVSSSPETYTLHVQGMHRHNLGVAFGKTPFFNNPAVASTKLGERLGTVVVHMPDAGVNSTLMDWHLTYLAPATATAPADIIYAKPQSGAVNVTNDDPFYMDKADGEGYFCSFVELGKKGNYFTASVEVANLGQFIEPLMVYYVAEVNGVKYTSLKDAIEHAPAGSTVTVIDDTVVDQVIVFNNPITLVNDKYVSLNAPYAFRFANGTESPVVLTGKGSFSWDSNQGSPLLVGANTDKSASYGGKSGVYSGSLVMEGCTFNYNTSQSGNMVKVENGSFVMNGGEINVACAACVKTDAEDNNTTATAVINGGVLMNTSTESNKGNVLLATKKNSGVSSITVNGGQFSGKVTLGSSTAAAGTITVVGMVGGELNKAKFDRDQSSRCQDGYRTVLEDGWYVVQPN